MQKLNKYKSKKISIFSFLIFIILQLITLVPPLLMKNIIDEYIPSKDLNNIFWGIFIFVLIPFTYITVQTVFNYITIVFARNSGNKLSIDILRNLINQKKSFFDKENSVELANLASKEAVTYINFYISELPKYYGFIITGIIILIIIGTHSLYLALLQLLIIPLFIFPVKKIASYLDESITNVVGYNAEVSQIRADVFKGIDTVKSLRIEDKKVEEVNKFNIKIAKLWGKIAALDMVSGIWLTGFLAMLFTGLTFGIGAFLIAKEIGTLTVGSLVSIISLSAILYTNISNIFRTNIEKQKQDAENSKLFSYLEMKGEDNFDKSTLDDIQTIEVKNLNFSYDDSKKVLENVNIKAEKGDFIGIVGKSGAGKSTLFSLLLKFYDVSDDTIFYNGKDINEISSFSIRDNITKISQKIDLFPGTLKYNLTLANEKATDREIESIIKFVNLDEYIKKLENGLNTDIGEAGKLMSGGEIQRLALAIGLLRNNKVLLLDEITSNIDKETEESIKKNILQLHNTGQYIIISISHNKDFLDQCTKIYEI